MLPKGWCDLPADWRKRLDPHDEADERFWRDWHRTRAEAIGCVYDETAADARVRFFAQLKLVKGKWGGHPFKLLPHAEHQIVRPFFGYKDPGPAPAHRADIDPKGKRHFRRCDHWVGKKNTKTTLGAGLSGEALFLEREPGVEVYSCAAEKEQAGLIYQSAEPMIGGQPTLAKLSKPLNAVKRIVVPSLNGFYQVLSAEAYSKHGLQPFCVLADELHAWPNRELWDVMTQGAFASRDEWMLWVLSTAGFSMTGIGYEEFEYARRVADGVIDDPRLLPVIWTVGPEEDWTDESVWYKANPALGFVLDVEDMRAEFRKALELPSNEYAFRVLRLNTWMPSTTRWLPGGAFAACEVATSPLERRPHFGGLDLSSTTDITAYVRVAWDGEHLDAWGHYWLPGEGIEDRERRDHVPYREWARQGWLTLTDGAVVDYPSVRAYVNACADVNGAPARIGYDPWNATQLCEVDLSSDGHTMVQVGQGFRSMSAPTKRLAELVTAGYLRTGGDPVLAWAADNVVVDMDPAGNIKPNKAKASGRIDPVVALIIALDQASRHLAIAEATPSIRYL